jgi:hypothetical protein
VLAFIRKVCSKRVGHGIPIDYNVLSKNWDRGGARLNAFARCKLETGIYLMAGFNLDRSAGHCVVLEVEDDGVIVHEDDVMGGIENLDWLHELTFVRQIKLVEGGQVKHGISKL